MIEVKISSFLRSWSFPLVILLLYFCHFGNFFPCPCILLSVIFFLFTFKFPLSLLSSLGNDFIFNYLLSGIFIFRHSFSCSLSVPFSPHVSLITPFPHTSHLFGRRESDLVSINLYLLPHYCLSTILCFHSLVRRTLKAYIKI